MTLWDELSEPWQVCLVEAWTAYQAGSLPIGAAVVDQHGTIVGRGRNRIFEAHAEPAASHALFGHRLAHAEMNALLSINHAAVAVRHCVLYTTLEPCTLCVGAIRMLALRDVRYASRDPAAGSLELFEASDYMRRGSVQALPFNRPELEAVLIAMNTEAILSIAERFHIQPPLDRWEAAGLPGVALGRQLFASGELRQQVDAPIEQVLEELLRRSGPMETPTVNKRATPQSLVLIVTGPPASGKSTLGRQLAAALGLPYLSKDLFKESLFDSLGWRDRAWSIRLGGASMALLFRSAAALLEAGQSVALESNFYNEWDSPHLRQLSERFACRFVQVVCSAPGPILVERFKHRIETGERHPGHTEPDSLDEFLQRLLVERWDALDLDGPILHVDTADAAPDIEALVLQIRAVS